MTGVALLPGNTTAACLILVHPCDDTHDITQNIEDGDIPASSNWGDEALTQSLL